MHRFFTWLVGKPIPLWGEVVIGLCLIAALWHWTHIVKWTISGEIWGDNEDDRR